MIYTFASSRFSNIGFDSRNEIETFSKTLNFAAFPLLKGG